MSKTIIYGNDAKDLIRKGVDAVANGVKVTLGPKGQNVLIDSKYDESKITKDGVTVAKSIELKDAAENAGAKLVKKVAAKTADDAGDGTTTATVLAQTIITEGSKLIASGINPMELKRGIDTAVSDIVEYFKDNSKEVTSLDDLKNVATVSANGDEFIGNLVSNAIHSIGPDGVVTVETSKGLETYIEPVNGLRFDRGYKSPYFVTDLAKMEAVLENPLILVTDQKISTIKQIERLLGYVNRAGRELLIISDGVEGEALTMLIVNKMRGTLKVAAVGAPAFGDRKSQELEDIATVVGATVVTPNTGLALDTVTEKVLGEASKVVITGKSTTIIEGKGTKEAIDARMEFLKNSIEQETSSYNKDILKKRLAKLAGGVTVLYVGALTEVELNEKKDRIDDALCATRAANEEGILPGGGVAYINAMLYHKEGVADSDWTSSCTAGYNLVMNSLKAPLTQIVDNGYGEGEGKVIVGELIRSKNAGEDTDYGYDARLGKFVSMTKNGIVDPTKVCRTAITNAASIAGMFLSTGCIIIDEPEEKSTPKEM